MMKLTTEHNVEAIVRRAKRSGVYEAVIGKHCEGCGDRHDPDSNPDGGARYFIGNRWLCTACRLTP